MGTEIDQEVLMQDDLRRCYRGCCWFVDNQSVTPYSYENAVGRLQTALLPGPSETLIACREIGGQQEAVEKAVGFFLGSPMRRAFGTLIPNGRTLLFRRADGQFLREATDEDIKRWNDAWRDYVNAHKK